MAKWNIDPAHSEIKFKVRHLVVSTVTGQFNKFSGSLNTIRDEFENASIQFEADIDSISTKEPNRDNHLKSADFFDAANFPKLTFKSLTFKKKSENEYTMSGDLTIRGTTKLVILDVVYNGTVTGMDGKTKVAGFEISGKINRMDYGLKWNAITEGGGIVVSDEVKLDISVELNSVE